MDSTMECNDTDRVKPKNSEKNLSQCHFVDQKTIWVDPGANLGLRGERPANSRLSYVRPSVSSHYLPGNSFRNKCGLCSSLKVADHVIHSLNQLVKWLLYVLNLNKFKHVLTLSIYFLIVAGLLTTILLILVSSHVSVFSFVYIYL
jgi:hypothetical protein